ncbi:hypothetical protein SVIOM342S_10089 [Streptomyces violaceorubidus]
MTSIRAGEPSTDAPQLSGRGGADAPYDGDPPAPAVAVGQGHLPARGDALRPYDGQSLGSVLAEGRAQGQLGGLARALHGGVPAQSSTTIRFSRALCRISLTAWAWTRP